MGAEAQTADAVYDPTHACLRDTRGDRSYSLHGLAKISRSTVIQTVLGEYKGYIASAVGTQEAIAAAA